jgi:hypothetical protein
MISFSALKIFREKDARSFPALNEAGHLFLVF